jgi:hypothetical protein
MQELCREAKMGVLCAGGDEGVEMSTTRQQDLAEADVALRKLAGSCRKD